MKIARIETVPVKVPLRSGMTTKTAHGEHVHSPYVIVRVHTDQGLVGLGEATVAPRWSGETSPGCIAAIEDLMGPALIGEPPVPVDRLRRRMDRVIRHNPFAKAAVEMALWDLAGKSAGQPLWQLLGGPATPAMPVRMVVGAFDVSESVALARQFVEAGANCLKIKVGLDLALDVDRVRAVRQAVGASVRLGIDANGGWDLPQAIAALEQLRDCRLLFAEQPVPADDPAALATLRGRTDVPIMADESVFTLADARQLTAWEAVDVLSVYPGKNGGIGATIEIARHATEAGVACCMGSNLELGIATAAMLHVGATRPVIDSERYPGEFIGPLYHEADLLARPLALGPAVARVPTGPGLGVALDEQQLERYRDPTGRAQATGP